ncbi:putative RmlC-like cupin family protein [Gordonia amarae]|nr:putative RmlC-like cupin family protein [Gordonia amarae]
MAARTASDNHHNGESKTAIFIRSGNPEFVFHDGTDEVRISTGPGDYIFVPSFVPHRKEIRTQTIPLWW